MPLMKHNGKEINVTDTGLETETSWGEKHKLFADTPLYKVKAANYYTQDESGVNSLFPLGTYKNLYEAREAWGNFLNKLELAALEPVEWEMFAMRVQQQLKGYDENFKESISTITENLENGHIDGYVERLEAYAEDLDSSAAEMARDVLVGAEDPVDADKAVEKYNAVNHTLTQIKNLPLATELQQRLFEQDKNFSESVVTISQNLTNRNIDGYVERLEAYAEDLGSSAAEMARDVLVGAEEEADADKAVEKYNAVMDAMIQLKGLSFTAPDEDLNIFSYFSEKKDEKQLVKLTGQPVSEEMQDILQRLENKEHVAVDEINNTKEIKIARSNIDYSRPTIQLDNRLEIQVNVFNQLNDFGSATIDEKGETHYNGEVEQGSRLDIVIGLPASGKSSAIVDSISQEFNSKVIDNDEAKKMIPQYNDGWGATVVHKESQVISDRAFNHSLSNQENIVLPKVGSNADKLLNCYIEPAKEAGYTVNIHFVDLDRDKALGRMLNRFIEDGRFLDPNLIEKYAPLNQENHVQQSYEQLKENPLVSGFSMWDNDVPRGERPILIEHENLTGNYIDNARKGDDEHGMESEHERGREGEVADGGIGRGDGRKGRYFGTVGEEPQGRDEESSGNRPVENINGSIQNEAVTGGAGQDERERAAGTIQVDGSKFKETADRLHSQISTIEARLDDESKQSERAGNENTTENFSTLKNDVVESFSDFIKNYAPDKMELANYAVDNLTMEDISLVLPLYVNSAVDTICAENSDAESSEYVSKAMYAATELKSKINQLGTEADRLQQVIPSQNLENIGKIADVLQMIKEENLSDFNGGGQLDSRISTMIITGKTDRLTDTLSEFVFASDEAKQNVSNAIHSAMVDIQDSIEKGLDMELYKEKVSLLLTGESLKGDITFPSEKDSFADDFHDILSTFDSIRSVDGFENLGNEITFTTLWGEICLYDIEEALSRYNLPDGYYVTDVLNDVKRDDVIAFNANEIIRITIIPGYTEGSRSTEQCNAEYQTLYSEEERMQESEVLTAYKCYVADDKQAYNVLLSSIPSREEPLQFYVEDTDGNAVASGSAKSFFSPDIKADVMNQIGVFNNETDSVTCQLHDTEEIQMMYERNQDITKLPYRVMLTTEYPDKDYTNEEFIFCADNNVASKVAEHAMNLHERLQSSDNVNFSVDIDVRPDIEEREINQMLDKTEQYRAFEYYDPEQDEAAFLLVESDRENSRITCTYYDSNLEKTSEAILNYESSATFGAIQKEFSISELLTSPEFKGDSEKGQNIPIFKTINADELRSDILDKQALEIGNDVIGRTGLGKGDKVITLYDKSSNEVTFQQSFNDIAEVDLSSLQSAAKGWDRYEVKKGNDVLLKGNVTDDFKEDVKEGLDELEAAEQEADERVLGDRELEPMSNAELAAQIADLIYAHNDDLMDISLDDIQADILTRIEDSIASGDVEQLKELSGRLESVASLMTDEEKTIAAVCAEQLNAMEESLNKSQNLSVSHESEQAAPSGSANELFRRGADDKNWTMKKIEENEEENYNFIDGTLNNVKPDKNISSESLHDRIEKGKERSEKLDKTAKQEHLSKNKEHESGNSR